MCIRDSKYTAEGRKQIHQNLKFNTSVMLWMMRNPVKSRTVEYAVSYTHLDVYKRQSDDSTELNANPALEIDYIVAPPRMAYYLEYSCLLYTSRCV